MAKAEHPSALGRQACASQQMLELLRGGPQFGSCAHGALPQDRDIAPKVEKAIHAKMEEIDRKMRRLDEDGLESVREELQKATPEISQRILEDLDQVIAENIRFVKMEILTEVKKDLQKTIQSTLTPLQEKIDQRLNDAKIRILISMGMGSLALLGILFLMFR